MTLRLLIGFFLFFAISTSSIYGQDTTRYVTILLNTNITHSGQLLKITKDSVYIQKADNHNLTFFKKEIKAIIDGITSDLTSTTLASVPYYVQTALPNGKGNHYYKNYFFFANEFSFGCTDRLNLNVGFELISPLFEDEFPLLQIGGKYTLTSNEKIHTAIATKYYIFNDETLFNVETPITIGNERNNITIAPSIWLFDSERFFTVFSSLSVSLAKNMRLIVDATVIDDFLTGAALLEYQFRNGFTLSLGTFTIDNAFVPNFAFAIPFGRQFYR